MSNKQEKESRAFEALFVSSMRGAEIEDVDVNRIGDPSPKEEAALARLGTEILKTATGASDSPAEAKAESSQSTANSPRPTQEQRMNREIARFSGLFVLTISLAIVALVVTPLWWMQPPAMDSAKNGNADEQQFVDVPLAAGNLPAGRVLRSGDIRIERIALAEMEQRGYSTKEFTTPTEQIVGQVIARPVAEGTPLLASNLTFAPPTHLSSWHGQAGGTGSYFRRPWGGPGCRGR